MTQYLRFCGPFHAMTGYAKAGRAVLRSALLAGYEVGAVESDLRVRTTGWAQDDRVTVELYNPPPQMQLPEQQDWELRQALRTRVPDDAPTLLLQLPHNLSSWARYGHTPRIGWTMTESDNLCRDWKHGCRNVDAVLTPSTYCTETFTRVVPEVPSWTVPLPVDERLWTPDEYREVVPTNAPPFLFISCFKTSERKMWRQLIVAFAEEFRKEGKEVGLILKPSRTSEVAELADHAQEMGAWVKVDGEKRTDWTLAALYRACNVYVQPSSEGQGLGPIEAAMCGLPSVALSLSGSADVVNEETGYVVPSHMAPIIGHMPQWYPRKEHNFACFEIDDLRTALRRAYEEEKAGAAKGAAARAQALERFSCAAVAPRLREAVERGTEIHQRNVYAAVHPARPKWATAAGAWGDVMCCVGNIRAMMADKEIERIGVLFYGKDMAIAEWLNAQPWCRELISFIEPDAEAMTEVYGRLSQAKPEHGRQAFQELLGKRGIELTGEIAYTHLCLAEQREPQYWRGTVLTPEAYAWADQHAPEQDYLVLNPLSIASNKMEDHWRYWSQAATWLLDNVTVPVVLVGEKPIDWEHPNLVNLAGKSRSMMDVLALAERSAGVITTSNNLGIYATIAGIEAVVVMARTCPKESFYHRWYEAPREATGLQPRPGASEWCEYSSNSLVEWEEPLGDFIRAVSERFAHLLQPERDVLTEREFYDMAQ